MFIQLCICLFNHVYVYSTMYMFIQSFTCLSDHLHIYLYLFLSFQLQTDLSTVISSIAHRDLDTALNEARTISAVHQFGAILNYISNLLIVNIESEKANLLQLADTTVKLVRCLLAIPDQPLDHALLLLRHVIYNRGVLSDEDLPHLLKTLCSLRQFLPFEDPDHHVWKNEALAKVANNIANALKVH